MNSVTTSAQSRWHAVRLLSAPHQNACHAQTVKSADLRGKRSDTVTYASARGTEYVCSENTGAFFEDISLALQLPGTQI